jgi:hypothetical protein
MPTWQLSDAERTALAHAAIKLMRMRQFGVALPPPALTTALAKITGTDTVVLVRRAYPPTVGNDEPTEP